MSDDELLYASISRGFKAGGFSIAALQGLLGLAAQDVDSEVLWAYEIGLKSTWLDNTLQFNAAAFYYEWDDLQSFQLLLDPTNGIATPQLLNVPKASLIGAEFEIQWVPAEGWFISGGLGILDSEVDDPGLINGVRKGNDLVFSPNLTFNGMLSKDFRIGPGSLRLQTNWSYRDDFTRDLTNAKNLNEEGYWLLNARASFQFGPDGRYNVSVWGENLSGSQFCNGGQGSLAGLVDSIQCQPYLSEPTFGLTAAVRFE